MPAATDQVAGLGVRTELTQEAPDVHPLGLSGWKLTLVEQDAFLFPFANLSPSLSTTSG
jgi:hypothetical protein